MRPILPREDAIAVWTGREMVVTGGTYVGNSRAAAAYHPANDRWRVVADPAIDGRHWHMRVPAWIGCLPALFFLLLSCDPITGKDAVGVTRASSGTGIGVVYVLCPYADVRAVALYRAPEGRPDYDPEDILWRIASKVGSKQDSYVVGVTPPGFVEDVSLTADLEPAQGLAVLVEVERSGDASVIFEIRDLREGELLRTELGDEEYFNPDEFRAKHLERCDS